MTPYTVFLLFALTYGAIACRSEGNVDSVPENSGVTDFEVLRESTHTFSKYSKGVLPTQEILTKVNDLESHVNETLEKVNDPSKVHQMKRLRNQLQDLKIKVENFDYTFKTITLGLSQFGCDGPSEASASTACKGKTYTAWANLYRYSHHVDTGRSALLDFRGCSVVENCCKNLEIFDNDTQSIDTDHTCVTMFEGRNCTGESRDYYPGSDTPHYDFGHFNNRYSSGTPCS